MSGQYNIQNDIILNPDGKSQSNRVIHQWNVKIYLDWFPTFAESFLGPDRPRTQFSWMLAGMAQQTLELEHKGVNIFTVVVPRLSARH